MPTTTASTCHKQTVASYVRSRLEIKNETTVREVRDSAAEILAAVGTVKLRRIALFRATKWAEISTQAYPDDRDHAVVQWIRAAEWLRIGWNLPLVTSPDRKPTWSTAMSRTPDKSTIKGCADPEPAEADFDTWIAEMVADQAPRVFAIVLEYGEQIDARIVGWGIALDESAYVTTVDGRTQYVLIKPENALRYVPSPVGTTPHLVWVAASMRSEE